MNKKKKKKHSNNHNEEDLENSFEEEENCEENEEEDEIKASRKRKEQTKNKQLDFKFDKESFKSFFSSITYYFVEIGLTYFTVCLLLLFIFQLEQNMFILWSYYILLIILLARVRFCFYKYFEFN